MFTFNSKLKVKIPPKSAKIAKKNKKKKTRVNYEPLQMGNVIETVNAKRMNVTEAAKVFNVPRQTLNDRIRNKYTKVGPGGNTELPNKEEEALLDYCLFMAKSIHSLTVLLIKAFAQSIVRKSDRPKRFNSDTGPSWKWWRGFKKHYPETTLRKPDNLDSGRSKMSNQSSWINFLSCIKANLTELTCYISQIIYLMQVNLEFI